MLLFPKKTKFRKLFKCKVGDQLSSRGNRLSIGDYGLKALTPSRITAQQIESARKAMAPLLKKKGKLLIRIFPDIPLTKKPSETRMGGGKGSPEIWCTPVQPGRIIFEIVDASEEICKKAFALATAKLPIKTFVTSRYGKGEL